nr:MAG TPA: hypothetical protein [Bacteriophage sp.]
MGRTSVLSFCYTCRLILFVVWNILLLMSVTVKLFTERL